MTYDEFASKHNVTFSIMPINARPDGLMNERPMFHYKVRIGCGQHSFGLYFSTGDGWKTVPELKDVLDSLASDAAGYDNSENFESWAVEYGFDSDSRKAEKIYRSVKRQAEQLERIIGTDAYEELLYKTERL